MEIRLQVPVGWPSPHSYSTNASFTVGPKPNSRSTKITHIRIEHKLDLSGSIEAGITKIRLYADGLIDPKFSTVYGSSYDFDSEHEYPAVVGWREMTEEELAAYREHQTALDAQKAAWERKQFEQLKRTHPDWMRDDVEAP